MERLETGSVAMEKPAGVVDTVVHVTKLNTRRRIKIRRHYLLLECSTIAVKKCARRKSKWNNNKIIAINRMAFSIWISKIDADLSPKHSTDYIYCGCACNILIFQFIYSFRFVAITIELKSSIHEYSTIVQWSIDFRNRNSINLHRKLMGAPQRMNHKWFDASVNKMRAPNIFKTKTHFPANAQNNRDTGIRGGSAVVSSRARTVCFAAFLLAFVEKN